MYIHWNFYILNTCILRAFRQKTFTKCGKQSISTDDIFLKNKAKPLVEGSTI